MTTPATAIVSWNYVPVMYDRRPLIVPTPEALASLADAPSVRDLAVLGLLGALHGVGIALMVVGLGGLR